MPAVCKHHRQHERSGTSGTGAHTSSGAPRAPWITAAAAWPPTPASPCARAIARESLTSRLWCRSRVRHSMRLRTCRAAADVAVGHARAQCKCRTRSTAKPDVCESDFTHRAMHAGFTCESHVLGGARAKGKAMPTGTCSVVQGAAPPGRRTPTASSQCSSAARPAYGGGQGPLTPRPPTALQEPSAYRKTCWAQGCRTGHSRQAAEAAGACRIKQRKGYLWP